MFIYILLPILVFYSLVFQRLLVVKSPRDILMEEYTMTPNKVILGIWFALFLLLGFFKGTTVGTDSLMYYSFYLYNYIELEPAIFLFYEVARKLDNYLFFQMLVYTTFLFFMFKGIKKFCPNFLVGMLFFILTFTYYASFNQIRQIIVVAILFYFIHYLVSAKINKLKFILVVILSMTFHTSAIFLLVFLLIPRKRLSLKVILPLFITTIIVYFIPTFKNEIGEVLISFSNFYKEKYMGELDYLIQVNKEKGIIQFIPVIIQMIIVISSYYYSYSSDILKDSKLYYFSSNILIVNLILYSLSGIEAIDRIQLYFSVFNIYFYSFYIHLLLNSSNKNKGIIFSTIIILFWVVYYALRLMNNHHGIVPYNIF